MNQKVLDLIEKARHAMMVCRDPIHDLSHVSRVVSHVESISQAYNLSAKQKEALVLAAWWHDVSRTLTKNPSFIIMPLLDDLISAVMLWVATIKHRLFGGVVGLSTRIILCKSFGAGALLTRIMLRKKDRVLVDILKDADLLDMLHIERLKSIFAMTEQSYIYTVGCRVGAQWFLSASQFRMKTREGWRRAEQLLREFLAWVKQSVLFFWMLLKFGHDWTVKFFGKAEKLLNKIVGQNGHGAYQPL